MAEGPKEKMSMDLDFSGLGPKEKPKFVKALIALGLPIDTFGLGLGLKPRPSSHSSKKNPKPNLMLQNTCLNHIFINQIIIPYLLFIQSPNYQKKSSHVLI